MLFLSLIFLILLFFFLGKSADFLVRGVKAITIGYKIPTIFSGLILGFFTSAPEFFIGVASTQRAASAISFGNLIGGILVLFGFVIPLNILMNRGVSLKHTFPQRKFFFIILYLLLPLLFIFDGLLNFVEGMALIILYIVIALALSREELKGNHFYRTLFKGSGRSYLQIFLGLAGVLVFSKFIVDISLGVIEALHLPLFFVGLLVFSFGTNLPEIIIAIESWKNRVRELGVGNVIGSALTNVLIAGIIAQGGRVSVEIGLSFFILFIFFFIISFLFMVFSLSQKRLTVKEGIILLGTFIFFLLSYILVEYD